MDGDDDDDDLLQPVLPVGNVKNMDGPPQDGFEYLARVRRESRGLGSVFVSPRHTSNAAPPSIVHASSKKKRFRPSCENEAAWIVETFEKNTSQDRYKDDSSGTIALDPVKVLETLRETNPLTREHCCWLFSMALCGLFDGPLDASAESDMQYIASQLDASSVDIDGIDLYSSKRVALIALSHTKNNALYY